MASEAKVKPKPKAKAVVKKVDGRGGARPGAGRKSKAIEEGAADSHISFAESRAKKAKHDANIAEMHEQKMRGELVEIDVVNKQADAAGRAVRDAFLAVPDRLAALLVGRTEKQIAEELRKEIRATLTNVSIEITSAE